MSIPPKQAQEYQAPRNGFRTFVIIWLSQSLSVIGNSLTGFSITIWLTQELYPNPDQKTQLALALSAVGLAWGIPHILSMPFAGAWADRHDRKRTMIACDYINGWLSLLLVTLMVTGMLNLWILLLMLALSTVVGDFHGSAFDTSYAMLVDEKRLPRANGMMQTSWSFSSVLSPALAAALIAIPSLAQQGVIHGTLGSLLAGLKSGVPLAILFDSVTFFSAALVPAFLHVPSPTRRDLHRGSRSKSMMADIKEGALFIWLRKPMLWLLATFTVGNLLFSFMSVLRPLILKFNLAPDWGANGFSYETALALVSSAIGIGGLAGGLSISAWGGLKKHRVYGAVVFMLVAGAAQVVFGLSPWLYLAAAASALWSGLVPFMNAHTQSIWQGQTPRDLQGRVFSVRRVIVQFTYPIGTVLAGAAGGIFNPGTVVVITGALLVLFCFAMLFNPSLARVEDKSYLDALAAGPGPARRPQTGTGEL